MTQEGGLGNKFNRPAFPLLYMYVESLQRVVFSVELKVVGGADCKPLPPYGLRCNLGILPRDLVVYITHYICPGGIYDYNTCVGYLDVLKSYTEKYKGLTLNKNYNRGDRL